MEPAMRMLVKGLSLVVAFAAFASIACAETRAIEVVDFPVAGDRFIDLGARFVGITQVTMRAAGIGGRGFYECNPQPVAGWYDVDLCVYLANGYIRYPTWNHVAYDTTVTATVVGGNWQQCEGVTLCPLAAYDVPRGLEDFILCIATTLEVPPISRLVITITADSIVGTECQSWGSVKALYRDSGAGQ